MASQRYDVAVIGAGAAGIAASVCSARQGLKTLLVEASAAPGGVFPSGYCTTICGLYIYADTPKPELANEGFPAEFASALMRRDRVSRPLRMGRTFVLPCRTGSFVDLAGRLIERERNLTSAWVADFAGLECEGRVIRGICVRKGGKRIWHDVGAVIDCTGAASVCVDAGEQCMKPDLRSLSPAVAFMVRNVKKESLPSTLDTLSLLSHAVAKGILPKRADCVSFMPSLEKGVLVMKANLGATDLRAGAAEKLASKIFRFLRAEIRGFERAKMMSEISPVLHRASRRLHGRYVLTGADVMRARSFKDGIVRSSWPIEMWGRAGRPMFQYLDPGQCYEIPARSLMARRFDNLFVAGRCISADAEAIASARVVGTCLATGEAAAGLATARLGMEKKSSTKRM